MKGYKGFSEGLMCNEHPLKTRQTEFLKQFPAVVRDDNDTIMICPASLDATLHCPEGDCAECRYKYWSEETNNETNS